MKSGLKSGKAGEKQQNGSVVAVSFNKAVTAESEWEDKDEFLDVIYWMRQILGLFLGIIWGLIPLKGLLGLIIFFAVNVGIIYVYYNSFQKIDDEEYGGPSEILKEGLMTSFSTFVDRSLFKSNEEELVKKTGSNMLMEEESCLDFIVFFLTHRFIAELDIVTKITLDIDLVLKIIYRSYKQT